MKGNKRLVVLDTHAILHRAYHALPDFSSSKGEPTGALYGLISMLVRLIGELKPNYVVAAVDLPGPTKRHEAFKEYKATRPKAADDLVEQIKRSRDVLEAFGIPIYSSKGYEADDVIGTIVEKLKRKGDIDIIIASGDMDTLQLVQDKRVQVYTLKKGLSETVLYDEVGVKTRFGFAPALLPDYKGLRGDPSDNIPGVKGIGEKTASTLIAQFGSLEEIYHTLKKHPDWIERAGIRGSALEKLQSQEQEAKLSKELGLIGRDVPVDFALPKKEWRAGVSPEKILDLLSELEFRSLIPRVQGLLASATGDAKELPSPASGRNGNASEGNSFTSPEEIEKLALAIWVLDSNVTQPTLEDIYRAGKSKSFDTARKHILAELKKRELLFVYEHIELPLVPILRRMEERGVLIDSGFLKKLAKDYHGELQKIAKRIYTAAGSKFNINSPRQLGEVLFDKLGLSVKKQKKTPGGARSTRESELLKYKSLHPIIGDILEYRELTKLLSTYIDTIPTLLDAKNRLHTSFIETGTTTGRLASQNPNLQNIPIKTDLGRAIRHAFVADKGFKLLSFDYSQIELRIGALLSEDQGLIEIFKRGRDVHAEVAARVFKISSSEVTYEQRRRAKVINFGILYGMGVNALREALGTTRAEAQEFYAEYFNTFPRLAEYLDEVKADAARKGYTQTYFGRRRYFEGLHSPISYVRASAERMAVNAPLQGSAADVLKLAMIRIDEFFEKEGLRDKAYMLLQVHDELLFEIEKDSVNWIAAEIKKIMEQVIPQKERKGIPFVAKGASGDTWGEMQELTI